MKSLLLAAIAIGLCMPSMAQKDSSGNKADTIRIGGMIIIKKGGKDSADSKSDQVVISNRKKNQSKVSTNWWIVDLGFANYSDNSNYTAANSSGFTGPGVNKESMKLKTGKSVNVNIWLFMQRVNLVKRYVTLKYGLGVELNNYRFSNENIVISKNPTRIALQTLIPNQPTIEKNKLAADYVTVPLMLNFNFNPGANHNFGFGAGVSAGYLYSARQKFKYSDDHKMKTRDDFDLNKWKLSYIGELTLGPIRLYGSLATKSMWDKGLDQTPYNLGIRFSKF